MRCKYSCCRASHPVSDCTPRPRIWASECRKEQQRYDSFSVPLPPLSTRKQDTHTQSPQLSALLIHAQTGGPAGGFAPSPFLTPALTYAQTGSANAVDTGTSPPLFIPASSTRKRDARKWVGGHNPRSDPDGGPCHKSRSHATPFKPRKSCRLVSPRHASTPRRPAALGHRATTPCKSPPRHVVPPHSPLLPRQPSALGHHATTLCRSRHITTPPASWLFLLPPLPSCINRPVAACSSCM